MSFGVAHSGIDTQSLRGALEDHRCGAAVVFEGRVRDHNEGRAVKRLEYEIYEPLAVKEGNAIIAEAQERWPFEKAHVVHRGGRLELGEVAVWVGVVSAHRDEAFLAARYIIDQLKLRLPIWKKEHYADGEARWVNCQRCGQAHAQGKDAA